MTGSDTRTTNAAGERRSDWLRHLGRIGADHGFFEPVAPRHMGLFVQEGDTLVISFDDAATAFHQRERGLPLGFSAVQARQVSLLSIMAEGPTWFRDPEIHAFFDGLRAEGFFDSFEQVIFLGTGPACGHAACAYASVAPGATVIASRPVATLDPGVAGFDARFRAARRLDFTSRFGAAPELVKSADAVLLFYDPFEPMDAAHAAQFKGGMIHRLPVRFRGALVDRIVADDQLLVPLLRSVEAGDLTRSRALELLRPVRRMHADSLLHLALATARRGQARRAAVFGRAAQAAQPPARQRQAADLVQTATAQAQLPSAAAAE